MAFQKGSILGEVPIQHPFACVRCWRLKKKCNKNPSKCGRCDSLNVSCVYSLQPPTERPKALRTRGSLQTSQTKLFHNDQKLDLPTGDPTSYFVTDSLGLILNGSTLAPVTGAETLWNDLPLARLRSAFDVVKMGLTQTCNHYRETMNASLPILTEDQLRKHVGNSEKNPEMEVMALLLGIYLATKIATPAITGGTDLDDLYSVLKPSYQQLSSTRQPCIELIQAGMLLAVYEQGQANDEAAYSTLGLCARMGHSMGLHESLNETLLSDLTSRETIETQRHVWWGLIILGRVLMLESADHNRPFTTSHPKLENALPGLCDRNMCDRNTERILPIGRVSDSNPFPEILFDPANSYARCCQATYLLSCVFQMIDKDKEDRKIWNVEVSYLDSSLQALSFSIINQSNNEEGVAWEYSCASWMICMMGLCALHRYNLLLNSGLQHDNPGDPEGVRASQIALLSCSRIATSGAETKLYDRVEGALNAPPFALYLFREMATMMLEVGHEEGKRIDDLMKEIHSLRKYLSVAGEKWKLAKRHLDAIDKLVVQIEESQAIKGIESEFVSHEQER